MNVPLQDSVLVIILLAGTDRHLEPVFQGRDRATEFGQMERLLKIQSPKDWSQSRDGGPRKIVREDLQLERE